MSPRGGRPSTIWKVASGKALEGSLDMFLTSPLSSQGVNIPLRATFIGIKSLPLVALATNNATQELCLFDDHLEFRVLRTQSKIWSEISHVDVSQSWGGPFLLFVWTTGIWTFSADLASDAARLQTLHFLQEKGVSLSAEAVALLENTSDA